MSNPDCPLCVELQSEEHVLRRWENFSLIFNRYPYVAGHLMLISNTHLSTIDQFNPQQRFELIEALNEAEQTLLKTLEIESTNIGLNRGPDSGASIPDHLHIHIVPRYPRDVGFFHLFSNQIQDRTKERNSKLRTAFGRPWNPKSNRNVEGQNLQN